MAKIIKIDDVFYFDAEDGSEPVACKTWLEKSKANEAHPEGKPWIVLPKGNVCNRQYFSLDLFDNENVDGEIDVPVKLGGPRVLGATGIKKSVTDYLDEEDVKIYTELVEGATEKFKAAKANTKKKKLEEMTEEELIAYIEAMKNGENYKVSNGPKSFLDMMSEEELATYNELLAKSVENKANRPKAVRGPLSEEEKAARRAKIAKNNISKAEQLLAALRAGK